MHHIIRMISSKKLIVILIFVSIAKVSWAANPNELDGKTDFCGVSIKFSDKPAVWNDTKEIAEALGPYDKYNISGLSFAKHKLAEVATCICREDAISSMIIFGGIAPQNTAPNYKKIHIANIGSSESWQGINETTKTKYLYQFTRLDFQPLCALLQMIQVPENSNEGLTFMNSITVSKSTSNPQSNVTPRERLLQLDLLRKEGLITQSDYDAKKKSILDSF